MLSAGEGDEEDDDQPGGEGALLASLAGWKARHRELRMGAAAAAAQAAAQIQALQVPVLTHNADMLTYGHVHVCQQIDTQQDSRL